MLSYHRTAMMFTTPHNVSISYAIEFFEKSPESDVPNTVVLTFVPQRINKQWYLELSEGTRAK